MSAGHHHGQARALTAVLDGARVASEANAQVMEDPQPIAEVSPGGEPRHPVRKPPAVKFGAIDVGTNSIHLVMAEISPEGDFRIVGRDRELVQLGKGGFSQHLLTPRAIEEGISTLKRFVKMAQLKEVTRIKAVATSAVREAHNGGDFVKRVREEVGIELQIISAEEEARLIYLGARHAVDLGRGDNLVVDIGGGSVEIIVGNAERPDVLASLKLGASRISELYLRSDPPEADEIKKLRKHLDQQLEPVFQRIGPRRFTHAIATSGTVHNVAMICAYRRGQTEIEPIHQLDLKRDEVKGLLGLLTSMSRAERLKLPGLDAKRVDALIPACMLLMAFMRAFDLERMRHCDSAVREGIILEHIAKHRATLIARATWPDPRTRSVLHLAERCGYRKSHAEQVARIALQLFDQLQPVHELPPDYRELLRYACLLHDIGYHIGQENHHKHSYYLIRNGELQGFTEQEIEIIANIARYHRKGRPRKSHYSYASLLREHRPPVRKLIALLRIANALDRTHYAVVRGITVSAKGTRVEILVHTDKDAELELWTARRETEFFEREFDRSVEVTLAADPEQERPS